MLVCKICKKKFKNYKALGTHLKKHKITSKEYYDRFLRKEDEGICPVCGKETKYLGLNEGYRKFCSKKCANSKENNPMWRSHPSQKAKRKISEANKGKTVSKETRKKISESEKGKIVSKETKRKISKARAGKCLSEETKKKISQANKGKHHSEETKKKISQSKKGKIVGKKHPFYGKRRSEETKKKISEAHKGKHHSEKAKEKISDAKKHPLEETRKKLSDANKGKHPSEETRKKMSDAKKGENHPNWQGGVSLKEFKEAYGIELEEWKKLAQEIRKRDNFTCQLCDRKNATDVHHIIPRRIKIDNSHDNLITLCRSCHIKVERLTDKYLAEGKDPIEIFYEKWSD